MLLAEAGGLAPPAAVPLPPGAPWWLWGVAIIAPTAGYALYVLHQYLRRTAEERAVPRPAAAHCEDCSKLPEATLALFRAHYGDRVTSFFRHFDRIDGAVMGETLTGEDGMAAAIHRLEELAQEIQGHAKHLREKQREWELREAARRDARLEQLAEQTSPGKGPR